MAQNIAKTGAEETTLSVVDIVANLGLVRQRITKAAHAAGRDPGGVTLVAVTKTKPEAAVRAACAAGQRVFGENRVQEAAQKYPQVRADWPGLELHLIGPLQTNKVADAVALFDVIETLDRPKLAQALAKEMQKQGRRPLCLVQVNTGEEAQKAGIAPQDVDAFIAACRDQHGLPVAGVMCIPPVDEEPAMHFALLRKIAERNGLDLVSMGMSADYEVGVAFGATHVRVGSAIFGNRG